MTQVTWPLAAPGKTILTPGFGSIQLIRPSVAAVPLKQFSWLNSTRRPSER